jgi:hypothetical protein
MVIELRVFSVSICLSLSRSFVFEKFNDHHQFTIHSDVYIFLCMKWENFSLNSQLFLWFFFVWEAFFFLDRKEMNFFYCKSINGMNFRLDFKKSLSFACKLSFSTIDEKQRHFAIFYVFDAVSLISEQIVYCSQIEFSTFYWCCNARLLSIAELCYKTITSLTFYRLIKIHMAFFFCARSPDWRTLIFKLDIQNEPQQLQRRWWVTLLIS